jgi:hypothetical protein
MPAAEGQNIIELGFNVEQLTSEKKQVLDLFVDLFGKLREYDGTKFNPLGEGGLADLKKSLSDGAKSMGQFQQTAEKFNQTVTEQAKRQQASKKATDDLTQSEKIHQKTLQDTITLKAKISEADTNAANDKAIEQQRLKAITAEVNANAKAHITEIGSIEEARASIKQLTIERDKENTTTAEGKARIVELNAEIDRNNEIIRANSSALEQQKINIGNYTGATVVLQSSLSEIAARLNTMASAGDVASEAYQKLVLEQKILQAQLDKQQDGFSTVTAELRSMKSALDGLAIAGLENTEAFEKLNQVYTTAKQKVNELHEEQKILTAEEPGFTALAAAARGLGGAYAVGAGASALFAEGNEKVEKELNKLVAIMTLLQGLEEAVKAVKDRGAIATALQATATKALIAAREIELKIFGSTATVLASDTAAKEVNTVAEEANTAALEANAEGAVLNTEAMEGVVIATEAGTAATIGFRTALISTGIGAIIIGIIYGITKLVGAISDWAQADERATEKEKALAQASKELLTINQELYEAYSEGTKKRLEDLEREDAAVKATGQNQFIQLAKEREVQLQRLQLAQLLRTSNQEDGKSVEFLNEERISAIEKTKNIELQIQALRKAQKTDENKDDIEQLEKKRDAVKAEEDLISAQYNKSLQYQKDYEEARAKLEENEIAQQLAAFNQLQKLNADAAERRFSQEKEVNDRILNDDNSSFGARLEAVSNNYGAEAQLEKKHEEAIRQQAARNLITEEDAGNQIANLRNELNLKLKKSLEDERKLRIEYNDRELEARNAISKSGNETDASVQEAITKDVKKDLEERLAALKQNVADKAQIIADDYALQVRLAKEHGKTETEIAAITAEKDKALVELTASTQKEIYDTVISYGERRLKVIQDQNKAESSVNVVTDKYNLDTEALNKGLLNNTVSYNKYLIDKRRLDEKYTLEKDQAEVSDDEKNLQRVREYIQKELDIRISAAQKALDAANAGGNEDEVAKAKAKLDALSEDKRKAAAEEISINKKLGTDKEKQDADAAAKKLALDAQQKHATEELEQEAFKFAKQLVDQSFENRINQIQETIDKESEQAQSQIAAIQRSTLTQRDQAAEIIILQAQQKARETQLKNEQKQEKIKEAKFDRDAAVAEVIWKTGIGIMEVIQQYGFPAGFALAATVAALGAVQAATILARPIPTYAEGIGIPGKGQHPGGLAWAGEEYKPELVSIPGRAPFIVDKPTLLDLPVNASVMPLDASNIVFDLGGTMMLQGASAINNAAERNDNWEIARWQTDQLKRAYKRGQQKIINVIKVPSEMIGLDANYLNAKIYGKR